MLSEKKLTTFNNYLKLEKEYEAGILFGFNTDTYDILGVPVAKENNKVELKDIKEKIVNQNRLFSFSMPPFSSYKIKGKPLFYWAREKKMNEIKIPIQKVKINNLKIINCYTLNEEEIKKNIIEKISNVKGDFRQKEILKKWTELLASRKKQHFIVKIKISTDSGFYVRSFTNKIGEELSIGAVLFCLKRTKIGKYNINSCIKLK